MSEPGRIAPMKAVSGRLPGGSGWVHELKWDGMRAICTIRDTLVRAHSSRLNDITSSFPELQALGDAVALDVVLDGEIVALDETGPSFQRLQTRIHQTNPAAVARRASDVPVVYVVFDLLHVEDESTVDLPYSGRRKLLEQILPVSGPTWRLTDVHEGDGQDLLDTVVERDLEGLVSKRLDSPYRPGRRTDAWVKVKARRRQELVVGGWMSGTGNRSQDVGSLVVGYNDETGLRYAGSVGSGLSDETVGRIRVRLDALATEDSPFADPIPRAPHRSINFVTPELVVEVAFGEWTAAGRLRHPVFLGERTDVDPTAVIRET